MQTCSEPKMAAYPSYYWCSLASFSRLWQADTNGVANTVVCPSPTLSRVTAVRVCVCVFESGMDWEQTSAWQITSLVIHSWLTNTAANWNSQPAPGMCVAPVVVSISFFQIKIVFPHQTTTTTTVIGNWARFLEKNTCNSNVKNVGDVYRHTWPLSLWAYILYLDNKQFYKQAYCLALCYSFILLYFRHTLKKASRQQLKKNRLL